MLNNTLQHHTGYKLVKVIDSGQSSAKKAIYQNQDTQGLVFAKFSQDKEALFLEYSNQKWLYNAFKDVNNESVIIPKPLDFFKVSGDDSKDNIYVMMSEYIEGAVPILDLPYKDRTEAFLTAIKFFESISPKTYKGIKSKSGAYILLSSIYFVLVGIYYNPKNLFVLCFAFLKIFFNSFNILFQNFSTVSHGDLNVTNLLLYKKKVVILDFPKLHINSRYVNYAFALNSGWDDKNLYSHLLSEIVKVNNFKSNETRALHIFVLYNLLQRVGKRYENKKQSGVYFDRIYKVSCKI